MQYWSLLPQNCQMQANLVANLRAQQRLAVSLQISISCSTTRSSYRKTKSVISLLYVIAVGLRFRHGAHRNASSCYRITISAHRTIRRYVLCKRNKLTLLTPSAAAETMSELVSELTYGAAILQKSSFNPVSLTAGADLLLRFVTLQRPSLYQPFSAHKSNLVARARDFVHDSQSCVEKIVVYATGLIKDDAV